MGERRSCLLVLSRYIDLILLQRNIRLYSDWEGSPCCCRGEALALADDARGEKSERGTTAWRDKSRYARKEREGVRVYLCTRVYCFLEFPPAHTHTHTHIHYPLSACLLSSWYVCTYRLAIMTTLVFLVSLLFFLSLSLSIRPLTEAAVQAPVLSAPRAPKITRYLFSFAV